MKNNMDDKFEKLGKEIDRLENLFYAMNIPMPAQFHVDQLKKSLPAIIENLKQSFTEISGENPWE
jgi:hypothetical protein